MPCSRTSPPPGPKVGGELPGHGRDDPWRTGLANSVLLADQDEGGACPWLRRVAGPNCRRGGHVADALRGERGLAPRVCGAARPGHTALAPATAGTGSVLLGHTGRAYAGPTADRHPGEHSPPDERGGTV